MEENQYFAAKEGKLVASEMLQRAKSFYVTMEANAYLTQVMRMWAFYNGIFTSDDGFSHSVKFVGEQGELTHIGVNHFRNIAEHILRIITAQRPVMEARAINTDYKSLSQALVANGILDYYMKQKGLEDAIRRVTEYAIVLGSGYIKLEWNATAGSMVYFDEETGERDYEGDLEFTTLSPFDVIMDGSKDTYSDDWLLTRTFKNKYDIAAKYPEMSHRIKGMQTKDQISGFRMSLYSNDKTDDIPVFEFFHKPSEAIPEGRYILFLASDLILLDTKLPYRRVPVFRIVPSEILGTPYGRTPMFDIYPIQEAINATYSTILTNQTAFGVQNVFIPRGVDISSTQIPGGLNIISAEGKPESIQLTDTPKEIFDYLNVLVEAAETISGINSVVRGNPEASLRTGNALALVQSTALQFMSGLQQSYVRLIENIGTNLIEILKDFATSPREIEIVGKNNRPYLKEFTNEDINSVSRVIVSVGNPLSKTTAGRSEMANNLLQMGLLRNPQQYFQVLNTGELDVTYEGAMNELLLIKRENELILDGQEPMVAPYDKHAMHVDEHCAVGADPEVRNNPQLMKRLNDHILRHMDALRQTDPLLLQLRGEQPAPPVMPPQMIGPDGQPIPQPQPGSGGTTDNVLQGQQPLSQPGDKITGPNGEQMSLPGLPKPPAPFENAPVTPEQMLPQG